MTDLNTMMWEQGLPYELRCRLRSFFLQNRHQALCWDCTCRSSTIDGRLEAVP